MNARYASSSGQARAPNARFRRRHPWIMLLFVLVIATAATLVPTPWALRIGGRFTPTLTWDGLGPLQASNGGHYLLFADLHGGAFAPGFHGHSCSRFGCVTLYGTAKLCSRSGVESLKVQGKVNGWLHTDGARTTFDLTSAAPEPLPSGWVVAFHGRWDGPDLVLDSPDNSFTELFTPEGRIRHITSTADAGTAHLRLSYGSEAEFKQACQVLQAGHGA